MNGRTRSGFTLVELLVAIMIIAIISGAVVALSGALVTDSAITMTLATQKQLTNQLTQFYQGHGRQLPNGLDSLLRDDFAVAGASAGYTLTGPLELINRTTDANGGPGAPRGVIYTGLDVNQDGMADAGAKSQGLTIMSWSGQGVHSLTVAKLNAADLASLNRIGITEVNDIAHDRDLVDGQLTYVKRKLAVGDPVVIMDPAGLKSSYDSFTDTTGLTTSADKLTYRPHFIVFGIGPNCSMVGDRRGGFQEAPVCRTVVTWITAKPRGDSGYYDRYMAVVKMPVDGKDVPTLAGVLEANGWPIRPAEIWYFRDIE